MAECVIIKSVAVATANPGPWGDLSGNVELETENRGRIEETLLRTPKKWGPT